MRKALIFGCALAVLLQASCGGSPQDEPAPRAEVAPKEKQPLEKSQPVVSYPGFGEAPASKTGESNVSPVDKEFFTPTEVEPSGGTLVAKNNRIGGGNDIPPTPGGAEPKDKGKKKDDDKTKQGGDKEGDKKFQIKPLSPDNLNPKLPGQLLPNQGEDDGSQLRMIGGKTIDEWMREIPSKDRSKSENAIRTVVLFGPKMSQAAAPLLIKELRKNNYGSLDCSIRVNAVGALGEILKEDNKPNPLVVKAAVSEIARLLRDDKQVLVKYRAAEALGKIGPDAVGAIPLLAISLFDQSTWEIRHASALSLGNVSRDKVKGPDLAALRALYGALKIDTSSQVRLAAIQALTFAGRPIQPQQQQIVRQKIDEVSNTDADGTVQIWAHMAVMSLDGKIDKERLKLVTRHLQSDDLGARIQAAKALWAVGLDAKAEIPNLIAGLDDSQTGVVYWCMKALQETKRWGEPALPKLTIIAKDQKQQMMVRELAQETIRIIQGKADTKKSQ